MTQLDLLTYPHVPGSKTGGTSQEAAEAMKGKAAYLQAICLNALSGRAMTPDECADWLEEDKLSIRPRFSELKALGKIRDSGLRRKNASGKSAVVWVAV